MDKENLYWLPYTRHVGRPIYRLAREFNLSQPASIRAAHTPAALTIATATLVGNMAISSDIYFGVVSGAIGGAIVGGISIWTIPYFISEASRNRKNRRNSRRSQSDLETN